MSNEEIIISVYGDDIEGIFVPEDISNLNRLINLARTPPLPIQSDSGVGEEEDKVILDEAKTSATIIDWFKKWCKESKRGGGVLITTSIKDLLTDFYNDYASLKTKELREALEAEKKDKMNVIKMAENLSEIVYQYIQWVTHNTDKQPDFQKCHEANDSFNEYTKALNNNQ